MNYINLGLSLDITGVLILFFFGPPPSDMFIDGSQLIVTNPDSKKSRIAKRRYLFSKIALLLLIIGFAFQLAGNFSSREYTAKETTKINSEQNKNNKSKPNHANAADAKSRSADLQRSQE